MRFGLSETQQAIRNSAKEFFSKECPMAEVRRIMETPDAFDAKLWAKCAEQGWTGIVFPEEYDGFGMGLVEMVAAAEEMGRLLVPGPFVSSVLFAGTVIHRAGNDEQRARYLAPLCRGEKLGTVALLEGSASWDIAAVRMAATQAGSGVKLAGEKLFVGDAGVADFLVVAALLNGELALCVVDAKVAGVTRMATPGIDLTRRLHRVTFDGAAAEVLARGEAARAALEAALDVAALGVTAEMVGGMQKLLDQTVEYAKTRKQFGKPIGTYQAVQHQCADMVFLLEGARSAAYYAAWALNEGDPGAKAAVSVAKAYASEAFRDCGNRAIQVHGGMGFTWENDAHLYYRRAKAAETAFGDATFHRERIARIVVDGKSA